MKKLLCILLCVAMLFAVLSVTACKPDNPTPDPDPTPTPDPDPNPDPNPDPDPDPDPAVYTVSFSVGDGSAVAEQQVEENGYATRPTEDPVLAGHDFGGWYKDSECTVEFDFAAEKIVADTTIYAKWTEKAPQYENVSYSLNISDLSAETLAEDSINGMFTINAGTEIRNRNKTWKNPEDSTDTKSFQRSAKLGGDANTITVSVPGTGKLAFYIQNGSSGADYQKVKITAPDGTVSEIEFVGKIESSPVVRLEIDVTEGEWKINRVSGTIDIFLLELECSVLVSEEIGFELAATGSTAFLVGESLDTSGIRANAVFESGKTEPIAMKDLVIDSSAVDMTRRGVYTVHVQYKDYEKLSFEVTVFEPARLVLHTDAIEKIENSSYGNGVYFNFSFKEVYKLGESFSKKGLSVEVIAEAAEGATRSFVVDEYEVLGFDSSTAGAVTLTVKYTYAEGKSVTGTIDISVVPGEPVAADGVYTVRVDGAYDGAIGAVVDGKARFTTVQQALDFLAGAEATAKKVIELAGGKYNEKLEITIPNLTVRADEGAEAVIEWDSLFGLPDGSGFTHVTDSTATVSVRESAYNLTLENVTISNYWNSQAIFDAELGAGYSEHRALALLVQADRFTMKGGSLLGYQDTVQFFTGRQLFEGVFIQGVTDFIFGSNNTTLFKSCTIHSISNGKTDGGYITAFKGNNKGTDDVVTYGAIFYQCSFTADADVVTNGNTAIGRPWGAYAAVAVIECELDGHISTKGFSGSSKNERYVSMNAKPTDSTVQFVEFGNTGAGAITEAVAGMRFLTAEEVANYYDYAVIFGRNNGKVSYLDPWDPTSDEVKADERTYYYFDQGSSPTGTSHTYDIETPSFKGSTLSFGELVISAENGNVAWNKNANALNMKQGAFITFSIKAGTEITVNTYPGYSFLTVNGVGTSSATFVRYFDTDTEVVIMSVGDLYLYSIIVNPAAEAPEAPTLDEIKVEGFNTNYTVGDELALEGVTVKAYYSDNSVHTVTDFEVNTDAVVNTAAGEYEVVFSFGGKSVTVTVAYEDPDRDPAITENTVLSFVTEDDYNAVISNIRVTTEGNFRKNGSEYQIQGTISFLVKAGTIVKVNPYANTQYANYTIGAEGEADLTVYHEAASYTASEDCVVVYTGLENNYLVSIEIICPVEDGKYVFGDSTEEGDVTGMLTSASNISISGTFKTHSGGAQMGQDSEVSFIAGAYATVTIKGFDTSYGLLLVYAGDELISMDGSACYVFTTTAPTLVVIKAENAGTEEAPNFSKSYITYIDVAYEALAEIYENTEVSFGSEGNYTSSGIDFSGAKVRDNGGNNSQISEGSFSFLLKAGATLTINGYSGYTNYTITDGSMTETVTDILYTYTATESVRITITAAHSNNYLYSFKVEYPVEVKPESFTVTFGSEGNYREAPEAINLSNVRIGDNGGTNSQVKEGNITVTLMAGATLTINGYSGYTNYTITDGSMTETVTNSLFTYTATEDVTVTITPVDGNNYFYSIAVEY